MTTYRAADDRYEKLEYRRAGNSGLALPALSLGLWQKFGADYPFETQREIVLHAFDLGVTHFDNANRYGPPHRGAEKVFGRVLRADLAPYRDELILTTKAGNPIGPSRYLKGGSRKSLLVSLDHSLRDLGTDYVDIFYHHRPDPSTPLEETVGSLDRPAARPVAGSARPSMGTASAAGHHRADRGELDQPARPQPRRA
jgi:L-glyceraldehyde 3-phosphate reductase